MIFWVKVVPERCQHRDETTASIRKEEDAELVENGRSIGNGGKKPVYVVLVDTLKEKGDHPEEIAGIRAEFPEHGGVRFSGFRFLHRRPCESAEEMRARGEELVTADNPVVSDPFLSAFVMEDCQGDGRFPIPPAPM